MEFECNRGELLEKIQIVQKAVSTRSTLPILTGILFSIEDGKLLLNSTDLEMSVKCELAIGVHTPGSVVIPARLVGDILRNLPEAVIRFNSDVSNNQIQLECESSRFNIKVLPPEDFPKILDIDRQRSYLVEAAGFTNAVKQIIKATSRDETRPVLTGVLFSIIKGRLKLVATDSYRLAIKEVLLKGEHEETINIVVPARVLEEMIRIGPLEEKEILIAIAENQIALKFGDSTIMSRLIEGEFPKYQQLLPESHQMRLELERDTMAAAVRRASLMATNNSPVRVSVEDKKMMISSQTADVGEASEELSIKNDVEKMTIAFNAQYLLDGLSSIKGEDFIFEIIGPLNPALIRDKEEQDFLYLLMPVRIGA